MCICWMSPSERFCQFSSGFQYRTFSYSCCCFFKYQTSSFQMRSKRGRCMENSAKIFGPYLFVLFAVHFHVPLLHIWEPRSSHFDKGVRSLIKYHCIGEPLATNHSHMNYDVKFSYSVVVRYWLKTVVFSLETSFSGNQSEVIFFLSLIGFYYLGLRIFHS